MIYKEIESQLKASGTQPTLVLVASKIEMMRKHQISSQKKLSYCPQIFIIVSTTMFELT